MASLKVYCDDLNSNPRCVHGPSLLFSRQVKGKERKFYACSAYRNRKDCSFFLWADEQISKPFAWKEKQSKGVCNINHEKVYSGFLAFKNLPLKSRKFCHTCFSFVFPRDRLLHDNHHVTDKVSDALLEFPTALITPMESSKKEAQFWFSQSSKKFIIDCLKSIGTLSCLCVGTPTIHEMLKQTSIKSILLDIDQRYHYFYSENEFCWFNMFNCHFMSNVEKYQEVLKNSLGSSVVAIVIDPPFGARIEPLANTVSTLQKQAAGKLNVLLVLPYFMEPNVVKSFPNFVMLDYQVQYSNHNKFQNKVDSKKKPSTVRIFTNISSSLLKMPESEGYYYCTLCKCWRYKNNKHCALCKTCPSKNGGNYKHCHKCCKCVKQTWIHCLKCKRCCLPSHHCYLQNDLNNSKKRSRGSTQLSKHTKRGKKLVDMH